jgi:hypothetical protein
MGLKVAVANGNWSSTSTWYGGLLPLAGDVVASNGFTVTIDQNVNVDSITNTAQSISTATAAMTGYSTPVGYLVEASNNYEPSYQAFDRNGVVRAWVQGSMPVWISYTFPTVTIINSYRLDMYSSSSYVMQNFTFEGWNGTSWVVLHTVTGNTLSTYTSPSIGNTTPYIKYRFNCTLATPGSAGIIYQEIALYQLGYESAAVAGGTFNLNSGVTVTCTGGNGIYASNVTCLIYSGTGTSTINANILPLQANASSYTYCLVHNGTGILNINGNLYVGLDCGNRGGLTLTGSGTLNVVGNILGSAGFCSSPGISVTASGRFNIIGDIYGGGNVTALDLSGTSVTTVTGNLYGGSNSGRAVVLSSNALLTVTGNLLHGSNGGPCININSGTPNITIIGNVGSTFGNSSTLLSSAAGSYIKVVGTIFAGLNYNFYSVSPSAINILTGPFISYATGVHPFLVTRMHYQRTFGSYFEYRDSSTGGALPPSASAPATRLVSPDTVVAAPIPANVRQGRSYALGSQVGTMIVPSPSNVVKNVPVDNTVGTGVLDPSALWNVPLSAINTSNSIGQRVKNAATVESTGAQIQTTLNNNP